MKLNSIVEALHTILDSYIQTKQNIILCMICIDTSVTLSKSRNSMEINEGESKHSHKKLFNTPPCKVTEII